MSGKISLIPSGKKIRELAKKIKANYSKLFKTMKEDVLKLQRQQQDIKEQLQDSRSRVFETIQGVPYLKSISAKANTPRDFADESEFTQTRGQSR